MHPPPPVLARSAEIALLLVLVVGGALWIYGESLEHAFCRDDGIHLADAERWEQPRSQWPQHFREDFWGADTPSGLYRPLTAVTIHMVTAPGIEVRRLRVQNLILHAAAVLALVLFARRLGLGVAAGLALAALAAAHPLLSEPVLEIVSRAESQAALGSLLAAVLACGQGKTSAWLVGLAWLPALLSKESALGASPMLLVAAWWPREGRSPRRAAVATLSIALGGAAYLALRHYALGAWLGLGAADIPPLDNPLVEVGAGARILTAFAVLGRYLTLFFWPARLSPDYSKAAISVVEQPLDPFTLLGMAAGLAAVVWLVQAARRGRRVEVLALLFAAGTFLPASNLLLPIGTIMAERLFYAPGLGLLLALVAAGARLAARRPRPALAQVALLAVLVAAAGAGAVRTRARAADWKDGETLFERALEVVQDSARVHCNLAFHHLRRQEYAEAEAHYVRALEIHPGYIKAHSQLALCLVNQGRPDEALDHWWTAANLPGAHRDDVYNYARSVLRLVPRGERRRRALDLIADWKANHPEDTSLDALQADLRR